MSRLKQQFHADARPLPGAAAERGRLLGGVLLGALLAVLLMHAVGVLLDFAAVARNPLQLDYGEGIVWQQTLMIPGPDMYRNWVGLPFIVFHYPPVYYLLVRAAMLLGNDVLATGRAVSMICGVAAAGFVSGIVLVTVQRPGERLRALEIGIAVAVGLLALEMHAFRIWTMIMRVDMPGIMFAMAGLMVGLRADGRFRGTALALLLCVAAVYSKQTLLAPGIAVFLIALLRNPRAAIGAAAVAGGVGLGALGVLQHMTDGGFLHHILGNNINRFSLHSAYWSLYAERESVPLLIAMIAAFLALVWSMLPAMRLLRAEGGARAFWRTDAPTARRSMLLLHFALSGAVMALTLTKSGGWFNYMLEWMCSAAAVAGVLLIDLSRRPATRTWFAGALLAIQILVLLQPARLAPDQPNQAELDASDAVIKRIEAVDRPVASENMMYLMRAGRPVIFEPAIVSELAYVGRWDETPLVAMMRDRGFAFVVTVDNATGGGDRRTPAVDAAMRVGYPQVEQLAPHLWLHLPPGG